METYESSNIIIGEIKQILKEYNLPTLRIFTTEEVNSFSDELKPLIYIEKRSENNFVVKSQTTEFPYKANIKTLNLTKNLNVKDTIYNKETHQYLGDYLRHIRDLTGINLMPLYNCFSGETLIDNNNVIYICNIRYLQDYTIAINSRSVEYAISFDYSSDLKWKHLEYCSFEKPTVINSGMWTTLSNYNRELELKLFIKIPLDYNTNIAVLEGNYKNSNSYSTESLGNTYPATITPLNLQLLVNDGQNHPFSDKLIAYLVEQVITPKDIISQDIIRIQDTLYSKYIKYDSSLNDLYGPDKLDILNSQQTGVSTLALLQRLDLPTYKGVFTNTLRQFIYETTIYEYPDKLIDPITNKMLAYDILWYIDKDIEFIIESNHPKFLGGK